MEKLWSLLDRWHEKSTGCLISLFVFGLFLIPQAKDGWADLGLMNLVIDIAVSISVYALWWWSTRVKKHPKGVVGIDLVLECDTREQEKRVRADFVETLKEVLGYGEVKFNLIMHSKSKAGEIGDIEGVSRFMDISGGRFLLKAKAKLRKIDGEERNIVEMICTVSHSRIQSRVKEFLEKEMTRSMRKDDVISHDNDIYQFRNAAERVDVSTRYILALASLVSGDYKFSRNLCIDLRKRLGSRSVSDPELIHIGDSLPKFICESYKFETHYLYKRYYEGGDDSVLKGLSIAVEEALKLDPDWYSGYLQKCILAFSLNRDLSDCWAWINKCKKVQDTTWCYSAAFLKSYEGNMDEAWSYYKKCFNRPPGDPTVPIQSEIFIQKVLEKEPAKVQLWFCLGLINFKAKEDYVRAESDFKKFKEMASGGDYARQLSLTDKYLKRCKTKIDGGLLGRSFRKAA